MSKTIDYPDDVLAAGEATMATYRECLKNGCKPRMAQMLAMQQAPRALTDRELFHGKGTLAKQFENQEDVLDETVAAARAHGYNPNPNDFYNMALARFKGDPLAFIPPSGGRGHIRAVCEARGDACEGTVNVSARDSDKPPKRTRLAKDIAKRAIKEMVQKDPALGLKSKRELMELAVEKHGAKE